MTVINSVLKGAGGGKKYGADISTFLGEIDSDGILQNGNPTDLIFAGVKDIGAIDSTTGVLMRRFQYNTGIKSASFPDLENLTIDYGMANPFYGCTGLTSIDLSSLNTVSGDYAFNYTFYNCTGLTSVDLSSLTTVSGEYACYYMFQGCTGLTSADLSSLTTISGSYGCSYMFSGCTGLTSADLSSLTTISGSYGCSYMFLNCTGLTSADLSSLKNISVNVYGCYNMFYNCKSLTSVNLSSLEKIGYRACVGIFYGCTHLTNFGFDKVTTISEQSFDDAFSNTTVLNGKNLYFPSFKDGGSPSSGDGLFKLWIPSSGQYYELYLPAYRGMSSRDTYTFYNCLARKIHLPRNNNRNYSLSAGTTVVRNLPSCFDLTGANSIVYERSPKDDTGSSLAWRKKEYDADGFVVDWTPFYTNTLNDPQVGDTIYSDSACTQAVTTISSIA